MKKCLHKNMANKFMFSEKYGEPVKVEYKYCQACGEIFSGGVSFIKKPELKHTAPVVQPSVVVVPVQPIPITVAKAEIIIEPVKQQEVIKEPMKEEIKETPQIKQVKRTEKPTQKEINKNPRRLDSEARRNGRKPRAEEAPDEYSIADILREKYGVEKSDEISEPIITPGRAGRAKRYESNDDPYEDQGDDDTFVFVK